MSMLARTSARHLVGLIHLWIGLVLCVPLVLLGLSGSLLVFDDALRALVAGAPQHVAAQGASRPIAEILAAAQATAPSGAVPVVYRAPAGAGDLATVRLAPSGARRPSPGIFRVDVDPVSLEAFADDSSSAWLRTLHALHANLLLPDRTVVGWLGVAMLALGASGLVNWWPRPGRWRAAFAVNGRARGAALLREVHGFVGIWAILVFMTVSASGVYLAFPQAVTAALNRVLPAADQRSAAAAIGAVPLAGGAPMPVDDAVALAQSRVPDARVSFVTLPAPGRAMRLSLLRAGQAPGAPMVSVFVDPWRRAVVKVLDPRDYTAGETILAWQHALHAGEGLGGAWRLLVFLSGLLPLLFAASGVAMWWLKRRTPRPDPARRGAATDRLSLVRRAGE